MLNWKIILYGNIYPIVPLDVPWPTLGQDEDKNFVISSMFFTYHKCTPALPNPTPANALAKCISERASKSLGSSTDLKKIKSYTW